VSPGGQGEIEGVAVGGERPIPIAPLPADPEIGFLDPPRLRSSFGDTAVPAGLLVQLGRVALYPPIDRGVINRHSALGEHLFPVAVADPERQYQRTAHKITSFGKCRPEKMLTDPGSFAAGC
jgi:hypothetical protein